MRNVRPHLHVPLCRHKNKSEVTKRIVTSFGINVNSDVISPPRPHPPEFRQRAVEIARLSQKPIARLAAGVGDELDGHDPCDGGQFVIVRGVAGNANGTDDPSRGIAH